MKDISELTYCEFCDRLNEDVDDLFLLILDYDDFQVWKDRISGRYFYLEAGENDASDFFEVSPIAILSYDISYDIQIPHEEAGIVMSKIFDCVCCGEYISDCSLRYLWFDRTDKRKKG